MLNKIKNYYLLISRMNISQVFYRVIKILKFKLVYPRFGSKLYPKKTVKITEHGSIKSFYSWNEYNRKLVSERYINDVKREADKIYENIFNFLNETKSFKNEVSWEKNNGKGKLWNYYLHYFEYILTLIECFYLTENKKYLNKAQSLVDSWIKETKPGDVNSWEPYTISLRLICWTHLLQVLESENTGLELYDGFKEEVLSSISRQAKFLYFNLEKDLANNHYTANGKALFWVGVSFPNLEESKKYFKKGVKILHSQLLKEVRNDGSQYENSTSYQLMTAKDYLEVLIYSNKNNISLPKDFKIYTEKMFDFLLAILKPDKNLPLVNDSVNKYPIDVKDLLAAGALFFNRGDFKFMSHEVAPPFLIKIFGEKGTKRYNGLPKKLPAIQSLILRGSNYVIMRSGWKNNSSYLLFDAGDIGPKHNSGHAHADNLNVLLYVNKEDIFVDSGTYNYKDGLKRNYYRSTKAHNTIEIEGVNQTTFWGPFRTGYIAKSKLIKDHLEGNVLKVAAKHDGYKRIKQKVIHEREIMWDRKQSWAIFDKLSGWGNIKGKLCYHLGLTCSNVQYDNNKLKLTFANSIVEMRFISKSKFRIQIEDAPISLEWNKEKSTKKIVMSFRSKLPFDIKTEINITNIK